MKSYKIVPRSTSGFLPQRKWSHTASSLLTFTRLPWVHKPLIHNQYILATPSCTDLLGSLSAPFALSLSSASPPPLSAALAVSPSVSPLNDAPPVQAKTSTQHPDSVVPHSTLSSAQRQSPPPSMLGDVLLPDVLFLSPTPPQGCG